VCVAASANNQHGDLLLRHRAFSSGRLRLPPPPVAPVDRVENRGHAGMHATVAVQSDLPPA
jgi:hypothetical protein